MRLICLSKSNCDYPHSVNRPMFKGIVRSPTLDVYILTATQKVINLEVDVVSARTRKNTGSPAGGFNLTVVPRHPSVQSTRELISWWDARRAFTGEADAKMIERPEELRYLALDYYMATVRPMDVVLIQFKESPRAVYPTMLALVDRVARTVVVTGGKPQRAIKITGRDFGKVFVEDNYRFFPSSGVEKWTDLYPDLKLPDAFLEKELRKAMSRELFFGRDITQMYRWVATEYPPALKIKVIKPPEAPGAWSEGISFSGDTEGAGAVEVTLSDFMGFPSEIAGEVGSPRMGPTGSLTIGDRYLNVDPGDGIGDLSVIEYQGSLWGFIAKAAVPPLYECFGDTFPAGPVEEILGGNRGLAKWCVVMRVSPFDEEGKFSWNDLPIAWDATPDHRDTINPNVSPGDFYIPALDFSIVDAAAWRAHLNTIFRPYHTIYEDEVIVEDVGISDNDTRTVFWALPVSWLPQGVLFDLIPPAATGPLKCEGLKKRTSNVERFGLRVYDQTFSIFPLGFESGESDEPQDDLEGALMTWGEKWNNRLKNWFGHNYLLEAGRMVIRGRSDIRAGERVWRPGIGRMFYVQGVDHTINVKSGFQTTLAVIRGQPFHGFKDWPGYGG